MELNVSIEITVNDKITALCQTNYIKCYKQQKWTLKNVKLTSFQKTKKLYKK